MIRTFARYLFELALDVGVRILPRASWIVVYGFPSSEGNSRELVRELEQRYSGRVFVLHNAENESLPAWKSPRCRWLSKRSPMAVFRYLRAEAVFVTHGLYGRRRTTNRFPIVNLWHGDGIKVKTALASGKSDVPSNFIVGSTRLLTGYKARDLHVPEDRILLTGNPRTIQLSRPFDPTNLAALGVDPSRPFVVWMPTFRAARAVGEIPAWEDVADPRKSRDLLGALGAALADRLSQSGIQLVLKPHPLDSAAWDDIGDCVVLSTAQIAEMGELYSFLGAASGLITDFSSVWVDYLYANRPIAFAVPDAADYLASRGVLVPDIMDWLPGYRLDDDFSRLDLFVADVKHGGSDTLSLRKDAAARLGLVESSHPARDLIDELLDRGVLARSRFSA